MALLGYVLLTVALTWPLVFGLFDRVPLGDNDLWQNYWNLWWWKTALLERGQLPYHTDLLYSPGETSLAFHTHSEANVLLTFPLLLVSGVPAAINTSLLIGFVLAAWGAYLLAAELLEDRRAAFLAGIIFGFFPQHFEQSLEHLNLASYGAMPLCLLGLSRAVRCGGRGAWTATILFFVLNSLFSWHNTLLILPGAVALFAYQLRRSFRPRRVVLLEAVLSGLIATAVLLPFAWPMVREILAGETYYVKPPPPVDKALDPRFFVIPAENHPFWGGLVKPLYAKWQTYSSVGFTAYVGVVALGLAILAILVRLRARRRQGAATRRGRVEPGFSLSFWTGWLCLYLILALGSEAHIGDSAIPLPFALLEQIPFLKTLRVANRFLVPAMLGLALLAGFGARWWLTRSAHSGPMACVLACILVVDFLWVPFPLRNVPRPQWVDVLRAAPEGPLLDVPSGHRARAANDMYLQTLHGRPLVGGYVSCTPPRVEQHIAKFPFLRLIFEGERKLRLSPEALRTAEAGLEHELRRVLDHFSVAVVALHLDRIYEDLKERRAASVGDPRQRLYNPEKGIPRRRLHAIREALRELWGEAKYADENVELYWESREATDTPGKERRP